MKVLYDQNNVRFTLVASNKGENINWLFLPGGPGCDSSYLDSLISILPPLPGNLWYLDFPGNGSHDVQKEHFDSWLSIFTQTISGFNDVVLVGHSFGGMMPLLFTECEELLSGFIILNSSPTLWLEEAVKFASKHSLPDLSKEMQDFTLNPTQATFKVALDACMPYYFPKESLEKGRELLSSVPCAFEPAVWWQRKAVEIKYNAIWVPQKVPTLIVSSEFDAICPSVLYDNDNRFNRSNIQKIHINGAGHMPWVERPEKVREAFETFAINLITAAG